MTHDLAAPGTDQMNNSGDPAAPKLDFGFLAGQQTTNDEFES